MLSTLSKTQLLDRLTSYTAPGLSKIADDISGGGQEVPFEQAFAQIAHVFLQDRAPGLLDHEIGFQLIDKNDDNSKAVGVNVFKIGDAILYAPVVFSDGELLGRELLYMNNQDMFVPLKENWVNYLLNRRPHALGKPTHRDLKRHGVMPISGHSLKFPPTKYAAAQGLTSTTDEKVASKFAHVSPIVHPFLRAFARAVINPGLAFGKASAAPAIVAPKPVAAPGDTALAPQTNQPGGLFGIDSLQAQPGVGGVTDPIPATNSTAAVVKPTPRLYSDSSLPVGTRSLPGSARPMPRYEFRQPAPGAPGLAAVKPLSGGTHELGGGPTQVSPGAIKAAPAPVAVTPTPAAGTIKGGSTYDHLDLPTFLISMGRPACTAFLGLMNDYPVLKEATLKFYPEEKIAAVMRTVCEEEGKRHPLLSKPKARPLSELLDSPKPNEKIGAVHIISYRMVMGGKSALPKDLQLDDGEKEKLIKDRVVVRDTRPDSKVTHAYEVKGDKALQNPMAAGLYEVLVKPGEFAKCAVIPAPYDSKSRKNTVVVIRIDNKAFEVVHASRIWAKPEMLPREEYRKWLDELPTAKSLNTSEDGYSRSIFIGNEGKDVSLPFHASQEVNGQLTVFDGWFDGNFCVRDRPASLKTIRKRHEASPIDGYRGNDRVVLTADAGKGLRCNGQELQVPGNARRVVIKDKGVQLELATLPDFELGLMKAAGTPIEIRFKSDQYRLGDDQKFASWEDSFSSLIVTHGLREASAREVLDRAKAEGQLNLHFKRATQEYDLQQTSHSAPSIPEQMTGTEPSGMGSVQSVEPMDLKMPVSDQAQTNDRSLYDPRTVSNPWEQMSGGGDGDQDTIGMADQAAQMGQKEIFDTSTIGAVLKTMNPETVINKHLGPMTRTMSRLGESLLSLYWNKEAYEERYGKQELPALLDQMRDIFTKLGDLILSLKEKEVNPEFGDGVLGDDHDGDESEG